MSAQLECVRCGHKIATPQHCGRPMEIEKSPDPRLVCWMGAECGAGALPIHCGEAMREARTD